MRLFCKSVEFLHHEKCQRRRGFDHKSLRLVTGRPILGSALADFSSKQAAEKSTDPLSRLPRRHHPPTSSSYEAYQVTRYLNEVSAQAGLVYKGLTLSNSNN